MYRKTIIMALLLVALGPLTAEAGSGDDARNQAMFTLDLSAAGGETLYVGPDGMIYRETNGEGGLQTKDIHRNYRGTPYTLDADKSLIE